MTVPQVKNQSVWKSLKTLFIGTSLVFLINIYFGFDNALTVGEIPRWQILIHLHGGSIGWITMSAIGIGIWIMTGDRDVDAAYERKVNRLAWAAVLVFAGYVPTFGLAFSRPSGFLVTLLPIFGTLAVLTLWAAAVYALGELKNQPVVTTVHILIAGALLVAAIGATVGMLLGLERAIGRFLPLPEGDRVGAHAGMMDTYLFLLGSCIIEWFTRKDATQKWNWAGMLQTLAWAVGATLVPIAFFLNMVEQILPVFGILLMVGLITFLARTAFKVLFGGAKGGGVRSWAFLGNIWLLVYIACFLYLIFSGIDFAAVPPWLLILFAHSAFVGMMTNLLFGVQLAQGWNARDTLMAGETWAMWLMNLGILVFVGLKFVDSRYGAIVMGVGVLLGVYTFVQRMRVASPAQSAM